MTRTSQQNRGMYLFFKLLADHLNNNGKEMKTILASKEVDVKWDEEMVKRVLWKPLMKVKYEKESTAELEKNEVSQIHEILMKHLGEKCGVPYLDFPHEENKDG